MDDLERQLKQALARKAVPDCFAANVLAGRAAHIADRPARSWRLSWAVAALASVVLIGGVEWQRGRMAQERAAGSAAKAKLELALKITRNKLQRIEQHLEALEERN